MADYIIKPPYGERRMGWGKKPALIVLDVCKAWWTPGSPVDLTSCPQAVECVAKIKGLVQAARKGGVPIVWTKMEFTHPDMLDAGLYYKKAPWLRVFQKDDPRRLFEDLEGLSPVEGDIVYKKQFPSAFFGTTLDAALNGLRVDTVVICGVTTSGAVRPTGLDASGRGFRPIIVGAACADKTMEQHNHNLFDLQAKYADVVTYDDAVAQLSGEK